MLQIETFTKLRQTKLNFHWIHTISVNSHMAHDVQIPLNENFIFFIKDHFPSSVTRLSFPGKIFALKSIFYLPFMSFSPSLLLWDQKQFPMLLTMSETYAVHSPFVPCHFLFWLRRRKVLWFYGLGWTVLTMNRSRLLAFTRSDESEVCNDNI